MKYITYKTKGSYRFLKTDEIIHFDEKTFYPTYEKAFSSLIIFSMLLLIKGYPEDYKGAYRHPNEWDELTPEKVISIFDKAFADGLLTCRGKKYGSVEDAWGKHPDAIVAEVPSTNLFIDVKICKEEDKKVCELRCTDCLWNVKKRKMPWCDKENKACKNVDTCPEGIW